MEPELPKIRSVHMTNQYLSIPENLEKFLSEFRQILKDNLEVIIVEGEKRYTCGNEHSRLNPNRKPFKHFEPYYLNQGLDDFEVRDFLTEYLRRSLICKYAILINRRMLRKRDLARMFGLGFERL